MIAKECYIFTWIYITMQYSNTNAMTVSKTNDTFIADTDLIGNCHRKFETISFPRVVDHQGHHLSYKLPETYRSQTVSEKNLKLLSTFHLPRSIRISLKVKREEFVLVLHKHSVVSFAGRFEWEETNMTFSEKIMEDCSYQGYVRGHAGSHVAVSICGGLSGLIVTRTEELVIEPVTGESGNVPHVGKAIPHMVHSCQTEQDIRNGDQLRIPRRVKRQAAGKKRYLEVLLAADRSVVDFVGEEKAKSYLLALMNIVNMVYQHETLEVDIEVVVVKIIFLNEAAEDSVLWEADAQRTVDAFCQWLSIQSYRKSYYGSGTKHDVAVLMTRTGIGPAGYAPITGMCNSRRSCAVVKDDGFTSAFIIAHEIAHVFGLQHDGHGNLCYGVSYQTGLMATTVQSSLRHYWWSGCSNTRMKEVVRNLHCLDNNPYKASIEEVTTPLGVSWSLDEQCRLEFGEDFSLCATFSSDPCHILWCSERSNHLFCKTKRGSPLDGTNCGHEEWCMNERCNYHGGADPVDGGWGPWNEWSSCSAACGVGFRIRQRRCNDPTPSYGGQSCSGDAEQIDTCKTDQCTAYEDTWAEQCTSLNQLPVRQGLHSWSPFQRDDGSTLCKLTCVSEHNREVVTMEVDVDDGTPCTYDDPDNICIHGKCVVVGCDGERDSQRRVDSCGVCGGDNSMCKTIHGTYSKKFEYSASGNQYERVLVLPVGAKNIEVRESQMSSHFLAIKDPGYSYHILNGGGVQSHSKNFAANGAWFKYTNNYGHEVMQSKGPLRKELIVEIHPMDYRFKASVTYMYTVKQDDHTYEKNRYHWQYEEWSECTVSCGTGTQSILYGCYDKDSSNKVEDEKCQYIDDPHGDIVECKRTACDADKIYWVMSAEFSQCSSTCGDSGIQNRLFSCEKERADNGHTEAISMEMCQHLSEPIEVQPCNTHVLCIIDWTTSEWSKCSVTCGLGIQRREVSCGANTTDDHACPGERPSSSQICEPSVCPLQWTVGEWSQCSVSCGEGSQTQAIYCGDENSDRDDHRCLENKPPPTQRCGGGPCLSDWIVGDWSECSVTCGEGMQRRDIHCGDEESDLDDHVCDTDLPSSELHCQLSECPLNWTVGEWEECSVTCGGGTQRRDIHCGDEESDLDDHVCDTDLPSSGRHCQLSECPLNWTVGEWEECSVTCGGGLKRREVYCGDAEEEVEDLRCVEDSPSTSMVCGGNPCKDPEVSCLKDSMAFCTKSATARKCRYRGYQKACCKSCEKFVEKLNTVP